MRYGAATSLRELGEASSKVITALIIALNDDTSQVCSSAAASLVKLGEANTKVITVLASVIHNSAYKQQDHEGRTGQDHAYDALWEIVVG